MPVIRLAEHSINSVANTYTKAYSYPISYFQLPERGYTFTLDFKTLQKRGNEQAAPGTSYGPRRRAFCVATTLDTASRAFAIYNDGRYNRRQYDRELPVAGRDVGQ